MQNKVYIYKQADNKQFATIMSPLTMRLVFCGAVLCRLNRIALNSHDIKKLADSTPVCLGVFKNKIT